MCDVTSTATIVLNINLDSNVHGIYTDVHNFSRIQFIFLFIVLLNKRTYTDTMKSEKKNHRTCYFKQRPGAHEVLRT